MVCGGKMKRLFLLLAIVLFLSNFSAVIAQKSDFPLAKATFGVHNFLLIVKMFDGNLAAIAKDCTRFFDSRTLKTIGSDLQMEMIQSEKDFASFVKPMIVGNQMFYYYYLLPAKKKLISTQSNLIFLNKDGTYVYLDAVKSGENQNEITLYAFFPDGKPIWSKKVGDRLLPFTEKLLRPFIANDKICVYVESKVYVHETKHGGFLFEFDTWQHYDKVLVFGLFDKTDKLLCASPSIVNMETGKIINRKPEAFGLCNKLLEDGFLTCFFGQSWIVRKFDVNGELVWEKTVKSFPEKTEYPFENVGSLKDKLIFKHTYKDEMYLTDFATLETKMISYPSCKAGGSWLSSTDLENGFFLFYNPSMIGLVNSENGTLVGFELLDVVVKKGPDGNNIIRIFNEKTSNCLEYRILHVPSGKSITRQTRFKEHDPYLYETNEKYAYCGGSFINSKAAQKPDTKILQIDPATGFEKEIGKLGINGRLHWMDSIEDNIYALTSTESDKNSLIELWRFDKNGCSLIKSWNEFGIYYLVANSYGKIAFIAPSFHANKLYYYDIFANKDHTINIRDESRKLHKSIEAITNTEIMVKTYLYNYVYNMEKESLAKVDGKFLGVSYDRLVFLRDNQLVFIKDGIEDYVDLQHEIDDWINPYIADSECIVGKWIYDMTGKKLQPGMNLWSIYDQFPSKFDQKSINGKMLDLTETKYVPQAVSAYSFGLTKPSDSSLEIETDDDISGKCWIFHPKEKVFAFMLNDDDSLALGREASLKANLFGKENTFFVSISNAFLDTSGFLYNQDLQKYVGTQIDTPQNQGIIACISFDP